MDTVAAHTAQADQGEAPRIGMAEKDSEFVCRRCRAAEGMALADRDPKGGKAVAQACTGWRREAAYNRALGTVVVYATRLCYIQ
jgi:hypothetical protein